MTRLRCYSRVWLPLLALLFVLMWIPALTADATKSTRATKSTNATEATNAGTAPSESTVPFNSTAPRLVVLDWTLLETLVELGYPPVGAASLDGYSTWVGKPELPPGIVDVGLRTQPNLELLSQLQPDVFLVPPLFANLKPILSRIAPVEVLALYAAEGPLWQNLQDYTREVARHTPDPASASRMISRIESRLDAISRQLPEDIPPLLIIQFMDDRHVRVYGEHGLYAAVLKRLGLKSAWQGTTNQWGFSLVGIEALADRGNLVAGDVRMVVVEPLPAGIRDQLAGAGLWQSLPAVARGDVLYLPPAWSFGGLPSARRFAELLAGALQE